MWYQRGNRYDFILSGFAYTTRPAQIRELPYTPNPDHIAWQALLAEARGEEAPKPPVVLSMQGMAALLPIDDWDIDEYSFRGPVKSIKSFEDFLGQNGWLLRVTVMRLSSYETEDVDLDIVVTQRVWQYEAAPEVGMDVEGTLWLQGYLWWVASQDKS